MGAKVKLQLQQQNTDVSAALERQKAVADKMAHAVGKQLKAQKEATKKLKEKLAVAEKDERLVKGDLAKAQAKAELLKEELKKNSEEWTGEKKQAILRVRKLQTEIKDLKKRAKLNTQ